MSGLRSRFGRRRFIRATGGTAMALGAAALVGCGGGEEPAATGRKDAPAAPGAPAAAATATPQARAIRRGGELVLPQAGNPPTLDVQLSTAANTTNLGRMLYDQVLAYVLNADPADLTIEPSLAASAEVPDAATYRFVLRPGVKMHNRPPMNGRVVTARDVKFSFDRLRAKGSPVAGVYDPIASIDVVDERTVIFRLNTGYAPFPSVVAEPQTSFVVVPEVVEQDGDMTKRPGASGPFVFDAYEAGVRYRVNRNPNYFREGYPRVDRVTRIIQNDASALIAAFASKQVHVTGADPVVLEQLQRLVSNLKVAEQPSATSSAWVFNTRVAPLSDVRVRRALAKAIDQQRLLDVVLKKTGSLSGPVPPGLGKWALPSAEVRAAYSQDLAQAKQLLAAAGLSGGFSTSIIVYSGQTTYSQHAELVQQDLAAVGVRVKIDLQDQALGRKNLIDGNFETGMPTGKTTALEVDLHLRDNYAAKGSRNWGGFSDAQVEQWIAQQLVETNEGKRLELTKQIQRRVLELMPEVFLPVSSSRSAIRPEVEDYWPSVNSDRASEVATWLNA
ncbi:MAG: ABC transporter substrate-binding protein [Chloroflexi bacterium]|nr:ABC transporter substrate-binding protein [Chloroflexota bacterium]